MTGLKECLFLISVVSCVVSFPYPISQPGPGYQNPQYVSAQTLPQLTYKQPHAAGYRELPQSAGYRELPQSAGYREQPQPSAYREQPHQYVRQPAAPPVYEPSGGLQNYASNRQSQFQKPPIYLNQINPSHLAAQAQEAFSSAARKAPTPEPQPQQVYQSQQPYQPQQTYQPQHSYQPVPVQVQYKPQANPQYLKEQPQPVRYVSRPIKQYRVQQPAQQLETGGDDKEKEDYDPNPSYQFGFDVKDDLYTNYQNRKEQREGDKITGSYSVVDSDGFIRTVSYTADPKEGFKAEVTRQPTDIVVKIPKHQTQFQTPSRQQQYIQEVPVQRNIQQEQRQQSNGVYQYQ